MLRTSISVCCFQQVLWIGAQRVDSSGTNVLRTSGTFDRPLFSTQVFMFSWIGAGRIGSGTKGCVFTGFRASRRAVVCPTRCVRACNVRPAVTIRRAVDGFCFEAAKMLISAA